MIKHFQFISTEGLGVPLLLSVLGISIWQTSNIRQNIYCTPYAELPRCESSVRNFLNNESCPYVSGTDHYRIFPPSSSKNQNKQKEQNKLQQNNDKCSPYL
jgi:hypothetical protein